MQIEQRRLILLIGLAFIAAILWHNWNIMFPTVVPQTSQTTASVEQSVSPLSPTSALPTTKTTSDLIHVKTDVYDIKIDPVGGGIVYASLLKYPVSQGSSDPVVMMNTDVGSLYLANTHFLSSQGSNTQNLIYQNVSSNAIHQTGNDINIILEAKDPQGVVYQKIYTFLPNSYEIKITDKINNTSENLWHGQLVDTLSRENNPPEKSGAFHISSFFGASYSTKEDTYNKVSFKKMLKSPVNTFSEGGWIAMQQHYFLSAFIPTDEGQHQFYTSISDNDIYSIGLKTADIIVKPLQTHAVTNTLYVGPEIPHVLKSIAPHLDLTIDYGFLWFISIIIFWLMQKIYYIVGNWGWSIVLVTILIKLLFYQLSATSYRSMAKMRILQPKIKALQERYGDDRQKLTQATMELYRKEKANPMTGCLPILIQIPVFIALYWVLVESVELRQAPFIFWITDLSVKDPFYVLPILNGLMMFVQQKLNPPPPDPAQAKMMMLMPIFLTFIFMNFPAGLVLYWLVNSLCSILQQWYIMRTMDKHLNKQKKSKKNKK
jgi:YidC/Oxa1 family membrane protein insertase